MEEKEWYSTHHQFREGKKIINKLFIVETYTTNMCLNLLEFINSNSSVVHTVKLWILSYRVVAINVKMFGSMCVLFYILQELRKKRRGQKSFISALSSSSS